MAMEQVELRNGATAPVTAVQTAYMSLAKMWPVDPIAVTELVELARDPAHVLWGNTAQRLMQASLLGAGRKLHPVTRDVVLSSFTGSPDDESLRLLDSPVAGRPVTGWRGFLKDLAWVIPLALVGCCSLAAMVVGFGLGRPWLGVLGVVLFAVMLWLAFHSGCKQAGE